MQKLYYSYTEFQKDTKELIAQLKTEQFDTIIGIARGGLTLAHMLSEALDIRNVQSISTQLYDETKKRECITILDTCQLDKSKKVLVVDDIADSGETLQALYNHLTLTYPHIYFKTATLFYKKNSIYEPDFWLKEATAWIEFFWEVDFVN
ncbi:Putative nucleotide phosphoribosyltransferase [hydrothermal vent metagenome]|uniref:Putative nucleotide phosphoribosyltransferase n=1 Tax=hydrothermal vent metagenome TaxID=652676 RepID=A0A1W1C441_9ZZZZ